VEKQLHYQLEHDILTSLPNRTLLLERATRAMQEAAAKEGSLALLIIDVNRFKEINDTFGYQYGDLLLQQVSARLCEGAPVLSTVARLGGDEFAILLPDTSAESACKCAEAIRTLFDTYFIVKDVSLQVDVSIGATLYPEHGPDALTLLRHADVAMYAAKQAHKGYVLYDTSHEKFSAYRLELTRDLRRALTAHEFILHYQPKVEARSGIVTGVEALVRWYHPSYGMVPPDRFIPLAEQTGMIHSLTLHLLERAIQQCHNWLCAGIKLGVAVNLSVWDLHEPLLPERVSAMLQEYEVPPDLLRLELTEGAVMDDTARSLDVLTRLFALGVHISIDDFGTGYSSLSYIARLPIDELKIDRSFVLHITDVKSDATIVCSTIAMAHKLGLCVVAEGVENQQALDMLHEFDCDVVQGYFLSRPLPCADLERWLEGKRYIHA
jgi:diguanylate cyclase (GGDEF)-like protein